MKFYARPKIFLGGGLALAVYALFDTLLEWLLALLHAGFELIEFTFDTLVEHLFHTDLHTSQTIAFYLMALSAAGGVYWSARRVQAWYVVLRTGLTAQVTQLLRQLAISGKLQWRVALVLASCALVAGLLL